MNKNKEIRKQFACEIKPFVAAEYKSLNESVRKCVSCNEICVSVANSLGVDEIKYINENFNDSDISLFVDMVVNELVSSDFVLEEGFGGFVKSAFTWIPKKNRQLGNWARGKWAVGQVKKDAKNARVKRLGDFSVIGDVTTMTDKSNGFGGLFTRFDNNKLIKTGVGKAANLFAVKRGFSRGMKEKYIAARLCCTRDFKKMYYEYLYAKKELGKVIPGGGNSTAIKQHEGFLQAIEQNDEYSIFRLACNYYNKLHNIPWVIGLGTAEIGGAILGTGKLLGGANDKYNNAVESSEEVVNQIGQS